MILLIQLAVLPALLLYLGQRQAYMRRRNQVSWQSLMARLQQWPPDLATPWIRFQRARILLEMADYADLNSTENLDLADFHDLASVRKDAMEDRLSSLIEIMKSILLRPAQTPAA